MNTDIAIIGAGATGVITAYQMNTQHPDLNVVLIEKAKFAKGAAYGTNEPCHLLNVPAAGMSAIHGEPDHFVNWLKSNNLTEFDHAPGVPLEKCFVPRMIYARYLESIDAGLNVQRISDEAIKLEKQKDGWCIHFKSGDTLIAKKVILTIGNFPPNLPHPCFEAHKDSPQFITHPWGNRAWQTLQGHETVLIIGTGLTMVDYVLSLHRLGHKGKIITLSRRGLPPLPHEYGIEKYPEFLTLDSAPKTVLSLMKRIRQEIKNTDANWRAVIGSLRPITQGSWQAFSNTEKKRFLRHACAYWDIHRHRIAPEIAATLENMKASGQLQIIAGRIHDCSEKLIVSYTPRHTDEKQHIEADIILNAVGPSSDYRKVKDTLVQSLLKDGLLKPDSVLGADIPPNLEIAENLYTLGPITKSHLWEIIAIPDIQAQCAKLCSAFKR